MPDSGGDHSFAAGLAHPIRSAPLHARAGGAVVAKQDVTVPADVNANTYTVRRPDLGRNLRAEDLCEAGCTNRGLKLAHEPIITASDRATVNGSLAVCKARGACA